MKEIKFKEIIKNIFSILASNNNTIIFAITTLLFAGLISFFYGLFTIPVPGGVLGFYRMEEPTAFEYFYLIFSAVVSAMIVTLSIHTTRLKLNEKVSGKTASSLGLTTAIFGAVCPACLGINFLAFGNVFTTQLAFLIPYIFWIQIAGIILLSIGLYLVAKSAYTRECLSCMVQHNGTDAVSVGEGGSSKVFSHRFTMAVLFFVIALLLYQVSFVFDVSSSNRGYVADNTITTKDGRKINIDEVIEKVTPKAGFATTVRWGDIVPKMIESGVLDPNKLEQILTKRYGQKIKPEWRSILNGEDGTLSINNDNAVFMMYMLWAFAKHNESSILSNSPIAQYFKNYDIGVGRAGYGDTNILSLNSEQLALARSVAENAYRPCCGNSTAVPDCSHGYSALGLVELMASQGFSKEEIFDAFVKFNSFWFPETYIKTALYFEITENKDWDQVDKRVVAGAEYSTLRGSYKVKNFLKQNYGL